MIATIYHNMQCSKSQSVKSYLEDLGYKLTVIPYMTVGMTSADFSRLIRRVTNKDKLIRKEEEEYKKLEVKPQDLNQMAEVLAQNPSIMERPIVVIGNEAIVARPMEFFENWIKNLSA